MKKVNFFRLFLYGYVVSCLGLFLYSYTQVDLNLTLSKVNLWQLIQKSFQYIGYYQRPLSTLLYGMIVIVFFGLYVGVVGLARKRKISEWDAWRIIAVVVLLLLLSYPAFSYDMYNYMFTAKTVLVYHKNPYAVIPLQFASIDPYVSFMRWTHLPSAYTPAWILLTLPAYLVGFGIFLPILWSMKVLVLGFYVVAVWAIGEILEILDRKEKLVGMLIFALNPLVLFETLVSGHNDVVMMALAMIAMLLFLKDRRLWSWLFLSLSIALKLMTVFLIPVFFLKWNRRLALLAMTAGLLLVVSQREVLPWYWVWIMPFVALLPRSRNVFIISLGVSVGLLLRYAPFLYLGNWDPPVPTLNVWLLDIPIVLSAFVAALHFYHHRTNREVI